MVNFTKYLEKQKNTIDSLETSLDLRSSCVVVLAACSSGQLQDSVSQTPGQAAAAAVEGGVVVVVVAVARVPDKGSEIVRAVVVLADVGDV